LFRSDHRILGAIRHGVPTAGVIVGILGNKKPTLNLNGVGHQFCGEGLFVDVESTVVISSQWFVKSGRKFFHAPHM